MKFYIINFKVYKNNIFINLCNLDGSIILSRSLKSEVKKQKKVIYKKFALKSLNNFILNFLKSVKDFDKSYYYIIFLNTFKKFFNNLFTYKIHKSSLKIFQISQINPVAHGFMRKKKLRRL